MLAESEMQQSCATPYDDFPKNSFSRDDEREDPLFYETVRLVAHLDARALATIERIIGRLAVEENPVVLDLMASWDSHLPADLDAGEVTGLGLNLQELEANSRLSRRVVHDLNRNPRLPFEDESFDIVLNCVSVDYLTRPFEVFREVGRVLKPNGLFLVIFSNRMFPSKAVKIWRDADEEARIKLVRRYFTDAGAFREPSLFVSSGRPRPEDDRYYHTGLPSDPVYALYAEKTGTGGRARPGLADLAGPCTPQESRTGECAAAPDTYLCPHCGGTLGKWTVPNHPFSTWDVDHLYICFNDECPYIVRGWQAMRRQGNGGMSYRFVYDPTRKSSISIPIVSLHALKEGIVSE